MKLQVCGLVLPVRAFELGTVGGERDSPVAIGYSDVRRQFPAKLFVTDAVLLTGGCGNRNEYGTVLVLLNGTDSADSDGKEFDGKVGFVTGLELENKVGNLLALKGDLVVAPDRAIIIEVEAQAAVQTEKALKTVIQWVKGFAEIVQEGKDENVVPETGFVLATGLQIVHEACQMPAFVQAHADSQPFIETGLIDDIPSARCKLLFVIGTGFEQEIEFAVVLETDHVLALKGDLT